MPASAAKDTYQRDKTIYRILMQFIRPWARHTFHLTTDEFTMPEGASLILANHTTGYDQFFVGIAAKEQAYFVLTENIMRNKFLRGLLNLLVHPIVHTKGKLGLRTVTAMLKHLKVGHNVIIFPEGNRNFDGLTMEIGPAIAKMVQKSHANLVTLRIEGGFFLNPRWGRKRKKGSIHVSLGGIYTPQQLACLNTDEVLALIQKDLDEDAYARQEIAPQAFTNAFPAEGMESALYLCPACKTYNSLRTKGRDLTCSCGFCASFDDYGYLTTDAGEKLTLKELCRTQKEQLRMDYHAAESTGDPLFSDEVLVHEIDDVSHLVTRKFPVKITVYHNESRLEKDGQTITLPHADVDSIAIFSRNTMTVFLAKDNRQWECHGEFSFNALKYRDLLEII